jgi:hypothetical protein
LKLRLGGVAAFVLGAAIAAVHAALFSDGRGLVSQALFFLCPGWVTAAYLLGFHVLHGTPVPGFSWNLFLISAGLNGLYYAVGWLLTRIGLRRERMVLIPVILGLGMLGSLSVQWAMVASQPPEPPPPPVDLSSPLAGRWAGVSHAPRGNPPVILVFHPRVDSTLAGFLYINGYDFGSIEEGTFTPDAVHFRDRSFFYYDGRYEGGQMVIEQTVGGSRIGMELSFVSPDTTRLDLPSTAEDFPE